MVGIYERVLCDLFTAFAESIYKIASGHFIWPILDVYISLFLWLVRVYQNKYKEVSFLFNFVYIQSEVEKILAQ